MYSGEGNGGYSPLIQQKIQQGEQDIHTRRQRWAREGVRAGLVRADKVVKQEVQWLWERHIPLGEVTIIEGDGDIGKSWLCFAIAAQLSREGKNILYISNEDDAATVSVHRLECLGARMDHIHFFTDAVIQHKLKLILPRNPVEFAMIGELIAATDADLVIFNPLNGYLPPGVTMYKGELTRPIFDLLALQARDLGIGFLGIRHFGKDGEKVGLARGLGGVDVGASVRAVLSVVQHPDYPNEDLQDPETGVYHRLIYPTKLNVSYKPPCLAFQLSKDKLEFIPTRNVSMDEAFRRPMDVTTTADRDAARDVVGQIEAVFHTLLPERQISMARLKSLLPGVSTALTRTACSRLQIKSSFHQEKGRSVDQWVEWTRREPPQGSSK